MYILDAGDCVTILHPGTHVVDPLLLSFLGAPPKAGCIEVGPCYNQSHKHVDECKKCVGHQVAPIDGYRCHIGATDSVTPQKTVTTVVNFTEAPGLFVLVIQKKLTDEIVK